jgi:AcrR family transcriptional regulator
MAYRKTKRVEKHLASQKQRIIKATLALIAKRGFDAATTKGIAAKIRGSEGMLYTHFANRDEILAACVAHALAADIAAMQGAADGYAGRQALARAVTALYAQMQWPALTAFLFGNPGYIDGLSDWLARRIGAVSDMPAGERGLAAEALLGALYGIYRASRYGQRGSAAQIAPLYALRCIGMGDAVARLVLERIEAAS